jgi:hypothetical protein
LLRLKERQVTEQDLLKLMEWRQSEPDAPDGLWYKDFGSFKICGQGRYRGFLLPLSSESLERPVHGLDVECVRVEWTTGHALDPGLPFLVLVVARIA